jgi:hypothetical protein
MTAQDAARHIINSRPLGVLATALLCTVMLLAAGARPSAGQGEEGYREKLEEELIRNDEMLREAAGIVEASESDRARRLLQNAKMIQDTAWNLFQQCSLQNLRACRSSAEAATRARREIRHAVQVAREESNLERAAQQAIDRAQHMLEEAAGQLRAEGVENERAVRLLGQARAQLERAREQFRERRYQVAHGLAENAVRLVHQVLNVDDRVEWQPDRVHRELERTARLIERARPVVTESGDQRAMQLGMRAIELQERAVQAFRDQNLAVAIRLTREARELVHKVLRMTEGPVDPELVERALEQTDNLIARAEPRVRESGIERAVQLFEKGLERQAKARQQLADEQLSAALAQTRVARRLVQEAIDLVESAIIGGP